MIWRVVVIYLAVVTVCRRVHESGIKYKQYGHVFSPMRPRPKIVTTTRIDRKTLLLNRWVFPYRDDYFTNWSAWTDCSSTDCKEVRFRECRSDSYRKRITDISHTQNCPFRFIVEKRNCRDTSSCRRSVPLQYLLNYTKTCGRRSNERKIETKILGGRTAIPHSWPWQVGLYAGFQGHNLQYMSAGHKGPESPFCGATIIARSWLVTAAHCLTELVTDQMLPVGQAFRMETYTGIYIRGRVGDHNRAYAEPNQRDYTIDIVLIHPQYIPGSSENGYDVALLKLVNPIEFREGVDLICLPPKSMRLPEGLKCSASGWGEMSADVNFGGLFGLGQESILSDLFLNPFYFHGRRSGPPKQPLALTEVELPLVSLHKCRRYFGKLREGLHVCAGTRGKDTCRGDSGGGLFCRNPQDGRWYLYGVTSFGSGRGCGKFYGVYSCVRGVSDWFHAVID